MSYIRLEKVNNIAKITLSKPPLNVLGIEELTQLSEFFDSLKDLQDLKLITVESDQKLFSAGVDIKDHSKENIAQLLHAFHKVFLKMIDLDVPTVSIVKSGCIGGGAELALFCDFVIASNKAYFSHPEIKIGCFPPVSMAILPDIIGTKKALELILTGEKLSAEDALNMGLINKVFSEESFDSDLKKFIGSITYSSASVIKAILTAYKNINRSELQEKILKLESFYLDKLMMLEDAEEGILSFLEKREPRWSNK